MPTIYDIATQLSVSPGLVSGVLNGRKVRAREETRQRIIHLARELNYRPSVVAKALSSGRTMQIGALASDPVDSGIEGRPDLRGLVHVVGRENYRVVVLPLGEGESGCELLKNSILDGVCDGLCLFAHQLSAPQLHAVEEHPLPCVIIGGAGACDWGNNHISAARVDIDNYRYGWGSVAWLVAQGHRRIAYERSYGEIEHDMDKEVCVPLQHHTYELQRGFRDAMRELCGEANPTLLPPFHDDQAVQVARSGAFSAVIVRYLHSAMHWTMRLGAVGIRLPEDLTVLAQLGASEVVPLQNAECLSHLAVHVCNHRQLGEVAGEVLLGWIAGQQPTQTITLLEAAAPRWGNGYCADDEN